MFSRRHPYLFFILVFTTVVASAMLGLSLLEMVSRKASDLAFGEKVGVIEIGGMIVDSRQVLEQIKKFAENDGVKAIVVRVDSPGGAVGPSQEIYRQIRKTVEKKKVIASLGSIAASGGYYIASAADGIVANPGTITGSIGVVMGYTNFEALFKKIGLSPVVIKSGEYKDIGSPVREMTASERILLQRFTDTIHRQFVEDVAAGRGMKPEDVGKIADGRIFSGEEAKGHGLVDRLGNLEDAVAWAGQLGGITGRITTVYPPKERLSFLRYLMEMAAKEIARTAAGLGEPALTGGYVYRPELQE
jgi:protease IV